MTSDDAMWSLLHQLDDPVHLENPPAFDRQATADQFGKLKMELERLFKCECSADAWPSVQDATYFGRIVVPASAAASEADLVVVVSNFWPLAMYALENPGVYDAAEVEVFLDLSDRDRLDLALAQLGHVVVSEDLLDRDYDGSSDRPSIHTWATRYFDYL